MTGVPVAVAERDGRGLVVESTAGEPLMHALRDAGLVEGLCGGCAACGTCHVLVDAAWIDRLPPPGADELGMLAALVHYDPAQSRLSCQLRLSADFAGLAVRIAPEE